VAPQEVISACVKLGEIAPSHAIPCTPKRYNGCEVVKLIFAF